MQDRDWDSIKYYNDKIGSCEAEIEGNNTNLSVLEEKLKRLEKARKSISSLKDEAWDNKTEVSFHRSELDCQLYWTGYHKNQVSGGLGAVYDRYSSYCSDLERVEYALLAEIADCRKSISDINSEVSWLERVISDCWGWLNQLWS